MRKSRVFKENGEYLPLANAVLTGLIGEIDRAVKLYRSLSHKDITKAEFKEIYESALEQVNLINFSSQ